jgi:putative ABC transport system substrate-binding protein
MRVGLNSGEVVVRVIGNDLHMDYSAVGETTHLAARMEQMAMPGSIRLTASTLGLVEGLVQVAALGLFGAPLATNAQPPAKVPRIGFLLFSRPDAPQTQYAAEAFRQGLREHGWVEGQNLAIEWRYAGGRAEGLPALAADLVQREVNVLVTHGPTIRPAQQATHTIPIVMAVVTDPVASGLVASLARPGGNLTSVSIGAAELGGKRLELLMQVVP